MKYVISRTPRDDFLLTGDVRTPAAFFCIFLLNLVVSVSSTAAPCQFERNIFNETLVDAVWLDRVLKPGTRGNTCGHLLQFYTKACPPPPLRPLLLEHLKELDYLLVINSLKFSRYDEKIQEVKTGVLISRFQRGYFVAERFLILHFLKRLGSRSRRGRGCSSWLKRKGMTLGALTPPIQRGFLSQWSRTAYS